MDTRGMNLGALTPAELQEWLSYKKVKGKKGPESEVARKARLEGERQAMALSPELVKLQNDTKKSGWLSGPKPEGTKGSQKDFLNTLEEDSHMEAAGLNVANQTPRSPYEMWTPDVEIPDFVSSQQKSYTDPEKSGRQIEEERFMKERNLAEQTPSLTPEGPSWLGKIFGEDEDLALAGGAMAEVGEDSSLKSSIAKEEELDTIADKILDNAEGKEDDPYAGLTQNDEGIWLDEDGYSPRHLGYQIPNKKGDRPSLLASYDDEKLGGDYHDLGHKGKKIDESPSWWSGITGSGDSSSTGKGLSPTQKFGAKLIADMFGEKEQSPQQQIVSAPMTSGKNFDMSPFLSSKKPKRDRYRNMGLLG